LGDFDRPHVAVFSYIYELPRLASVPHFLSQVVGGWQIASYHAFQSGNPFTVFTGSDASLSGVGNDRPNLVGNPTISGDRSKGDKLARWFNSSAFVANSPGTFGNAGRNILRAPGDVRWDMSVKKVFYGFEKYRVELRSDINNLLNHTVFDAPGNS